MLIYRGDYAYGFFVIGDGPDFGDPTEQRPFQIYPGGVIGIHWPTDKSQSQPLVTNSYPSVYALNYGYGLLAWSLTPDQTAMLKLSKDAGDRQGICIVFDDPNYQLKRTRVLRSKLVVFDRPLP